MATILGRLGKGPRPSSTDRIRLIPYLIERVSGCRCLYCSVELELEDVAIDHLNNDSSDNRPENLCISCQSCNVKKANDTRLQMIAMAKLESNSKSSFDNFKYSEDESHQEPSTEIEISKRNKKIVKQFILEILNTEGSIPYGEALNSATMICQEKTETGSQESVRKYLDMYTSRAGPFMISKDENGKKIIVKRSGK